MMTVKFKETGELGVLLGRGWNWISNEIVKKFTVTVGDKVPCFQLSLTSNWVLSCDLCISCLWYERFSNLF